MAFSNEPPIFSFPKTEIPGWLFFFVFLAFASVRARAASADSDSDDALSDFTNDLFTDLGPLLALFGEQMTKQYISESTTFYDYFIFGMGPIGVITTIVSTIRLCGPASLRAFIGRSREGNSAIEAELCTSTSRDVCEVFNNGGITRVLGRPKILELIHAPKNYLPYAPNHHKLNQKAGLYLFRDFVQDTLFSWAPGSATQPEWCLQPLQQLSPASQNPPNLSLNVGITQHDPWVFYVVALVGFILQAGVLVVAGVGVWVLGWNLNESTTASITYAPTIFIVGTILMCGGMCACIAIIGLATTKVRCKRAPSVTGSPVTSLIWLQPRQVIADQSFDACAFIEEDEKRLSVWTSSIKSWDLSPGSEKRFKSATCIAVLAVLVGYIFQFIGLRGMKAWVSMSQLITTVVMSILRGMLRMQRVKKEDNQLLMKGDLVRGHELDWLALEISRRDSLNEQFKQEDDHTDLTQAKLRSPHTMVSATQSHPSFQSLMNLRICLAGMTGHISQHVTQMQPMHAPAPWHDEIPKVCEKAKELAAALGQVAGIVCKEKRMISLNLLGSQFCRPQSITNKGSQDEKGFNVHLEPPDNQSSSNWRIDHVEIEAILGLALWSLVSDRRLLYREVRSQVESTKAERVPNKRIMSAGVDPHKINGELELVCWHAMVKISDPNPFPRFGTSEKMAIPLDTDLDSYSLGSLWQASRTHTALDSPFKELRTRNWIDTPENDVISGECQISPTLVKRLCGWSWVLGEQRHIQSTKQTWSEQALGHAKKHPKIIWVQLSTINSSLLNICTQELFGAFLARLQMQADHHDDCEPVQTGFNAKYLKEKVETIKAVSDVFLGFGLGSETDAMNCILPALENRQNGGGLDRVIFIVLSCCDMFLERFEKTDALMVAELAIQALHSRETREEERFFARALCMLFKIQRFEMSNDTGPRTREYHVMVCSGLWEQAAQRPNAGHFRLATIKELHRIHGSLWECREDNESDKSDVYDTLLEGLKKEDRFETMRSLVLLKKDSRNSFSAQEKHFARTALPLAAKRGWFEAVDSLLSIGLDPLAQDEAGRTALGYCAEYAHFEHEVCAEIILSHDKAPDASKYTSWSADDGRTPLLWAITHGHEEMVRILLKNGCPVNEQGARKLSPLGEAISQDLESTARQLVDAGTELRPEHIVSAKSGNSTGMKRLVEGYFKVHLHEWPDQWLERMPEVIEHGDVDDVQVLLDHGAKYSFRDIVQGVRIGSPAVKPLFLELVHNYVATFPNHTREWLLKLAGEDDHSTLQALLDHGASVVWDGA